MLVFIIIKTHFSHVHVVLSLTFARTTCKFYREDTQLSIRTAVVNIELRPSNICPPAHRKHCNQMGFREISY